MAPHWASPSVPSACLSLWRYSELPSSTGAPANPYCRSFALPFNAIVAGSPGISQEWNKVL